jgi:phospholipid/cholesterol/gamma-HCH transport system substrate-binding protein
MLRLMKKQLLEITVGFFMLAGMLALFFLAFKMSNWSQYSSHNAFTVTALFDNIGDLKVRAPVTIAGVRIGEVHAISLDDTTLRARVTFLVDKRENNLPVDTVAKILTAGIIGANYISLVPGYSDEVLKNGDQITDTQPAIILENLIGQMIYQLKDKDNNKAKK